ncbi:hypothetical protein AB6A40_007648 [Gnathostoma spinigerum]|uniref:Sushi domain-containing protein n=1 Tax=Gnathostoma spinigerum TaxID=75299 RepID=A0ABD6ELU5_9BILA
MPWNGYISYSSGQQIGPFPSQTIAYVTCYPGYHISDGVAESTCQNGDFHPPLTANCVQEETPLCYSHYPSPPHGQTVYSNGAVSPPFPAGTKVSIICQPGYHPPKTEAAVCYEGKFKPPNILACDQGDEPGKPCYMGIPVPWNGQISYSAGGLLGPYPSGSVATATCNPGYVISGTTASTCENGAWTPEIQVHCRANTGQPCVFGQNPPINGRIEYSGVTQYPPFASGTTGTASCNPGFAISGSTYTVCQSGEWTTTISATCTPLGMNSCTVGPPPPLNGRITFSNGSPFGPYPSGTYANVTCVPGFFVQGTSDSVCQNGNWEPQITASCIPGGGDPCNDGLATPWMASVQYSNHQLYGPYPLGVTAKMLCSNGFLPVGETNSICRNGCWHPEELGHCVRSGQACQSGLTTPWNGYLSYSSGGSIGPYPSGTTVILACRSGSVTVGTNVSVCNHGEWEPSELGLCRDNSGHSQPCTSMMPVVPGGYVLYDDSKISPPFPSGSRAYMFCYNGMQSSGSSSSLCQNGRWNPSSFASCSYAGTRGADPARTGTQVGQMCPAKRSPEHGIVLYSAMISEYYPAGTAAMIRCDQGYQVSNGGGSAVCQDGSWQPNDIGFCQQEADLQTFYDPSNSCTSKLPKVANGIIRYSTLKQQPPFANGTLAVVQCERRYEWSGNTTTFMCSDGNWNWIPGVCGTTGNNDR